MLQEAELRYECAARLLVRIVGDRDRTDTLACQVETDETEQTEGKSVASNPRAPSPVGSAKNPEEYTPDELSVVKEALNKVNLNISLCKVKRRDWTEAERRCNEVLLTEPKNIKVLILGNSLCR